MGGGRSNEIKETEAQRAAAEVARKQWKIYENELKGFEDTFIQRVDNYNSDQNMGNTKQDTDLAYAAQFSQSRGQASSQLASIGVDPSSSKYQSAMSDIALDQAVMQADTINRAQTAEQDKHAAGLQDIASMGMGQKAEALSGMGDVANSSLRKAQQDAQDAFNRSSANQQLAGAIAGGAAANYMHPKQVVKAQAPKQPGLSTATHGMTQNGMQVSSMKYDPLGRTW